MAHISRTNLFSRILKNGLGQYTWLHILIFFLPLNNLPSIVCVYDAKNVFTGLPHPEVKLLKILLENFLIDDYPEWIVCKKIYF